MATYANKILEEFTLAEAELLKATHNEYEQAHINDVLTKIGAKTEIFLKSVVFPAENSRNTFEWFINKLTDENISRSSTDFLHTLRKKYNKAKHDPQIDFELLNILDVIQDAKKAIEEIKNKNLGSITAIFNPRLKRLFWIVVWDHFIGGDSEVHIILPGESEHWLGPPTFDIIYIEMLAWDNIKQDLALLGVFRSGKGIIPEERYESFRNDSDFLEACVFEGDYRTLITTLAQYELRQKLLTSLNRHDNFGSVIIAFLLSIIDVVSIAKDENSLSTTLLKQVTDLYAVPPDYPLLEVLSEEMADIISQLDFNDWNKITGPSWVNKDRYAEISKNALAKHRTYQIAVDDNYVLRMQWDYK